MSKKQNRDMRLQNKFKENPERLIRLKHRKIKLWGELTLKGHRIFIECYHSNLFHPGIYTNKIRKYVRTYATFQRNK